MEKWEEKTQTIFLHTSSSPYRNVTVDRVEDRRNPSGMSVCASPTTAKPL